MRLISISIVGAILILAVVGTAYIFISKLSASTAKSRDTNLCRSISLNELSLEYTYLNTYSNPPYDATTTSYFNQTLLECFIYTSLTIDYTKYPFPLYNPTLGPKIEVEDALKETPLVKPNFSIMLHAIASCSVDDGYTGIGACEIATNGFEDDPHATRTAATKFQFDELVAKTMGDTQ